MNEKPTFGTDKTSGTATVRMWADNSVEAADLQNCLREKGYAVETILTGASEPILRSGACYVSGYANIHSKFLS